MEYSKEFLMKLDQSQIKEKYVRITSLSIDDLPLQRLEGKMSGGNLNLDSKSAMKRICNNLTINAITPDEPINDVYWAYKNKFELEIGLKNNIDAKYPDIIWFKQGIYIITSFSKSENANGFSISISGNDKMSRLDGTVSGVLPSQIDFGTEEYVDRDTNITTITKIPIRKIIKNAVVEFGNERPDNIIINDLEDVGYELWAYRGEKDLYMIAEAVNGDIGNIINVTMDENTMVYLENEKITLNSDSIKYYSLNTLDPNYNDNATIIKLSAAANGKNYYVIKVVYGETAGYHKIPLVYDGDLILGAGQTVTNLLDKLVTMLGEYEYFYDLYGKFVFQKKKNYLQELFSPYDGTLAKPLMLNTPYAYEFKDKTFFTSIGSNPDMKNIKNIFSIWGNRKGIGGTELPIHAVYALDKKPMEYTTLDSKNYRVKDGWDWRELIYQMASDFYHHNEEPNYMARVAKLNPGLVKNNKTGYEFYYKELQGFWRQLYNPTPTEEEAEKFYDKNSEYKYWTKTIHTAPNTLNFWFDFLDAEGELKKYSVQQIGIRNKTDNNSGARSIYNRETPEVIFVVQDEKNDWENDGNLNYVEFQIPKEMEQLFTRSTQGISIIDRANDNIYNHLCEVEGLSLTCIPIYHLQPGCRIYIDGMGDYIVSNITYGLNYNGTMGLTCSKVIKQFN